MNEFRTKKAVSKETFVFLAILIATTVYFGTTMGFDVMFDVIIKTAHDLLLDTVFKIMAIAVLAGAFAALMTEFGVVSLINKVLSPIMRPLYNLPGAASLGIITTYLSDNPAIISLTKDKSFTKFFKEHEIPTLCNLGTAFGMGMVLSFYLFSLNADFLPAIIVGNLSALIGSIVSVKIMLHHTKKYYGVTKESERESSLSAEQLSKVREIRPGNTLERFLEAILDGGKNGVEMGLAIIPGVLVICTAVMMLTFGPQGANGEYIGAAYEGVGLFPQLASYIAPVLEFFFGFTSTEAVTLPITSLGAVGAAMGMVPRLLDGGLIASNDIAVFTAMGMCWSGYLSTHVGMMDALGVKRLANKAIISHTFGGLAAGISANYIYKLVVLVMG
ncbi:hypothetical protein [Fusibacter sp. A1]|uniref:CD0519/CD1768 family membrane protein n=2 Tax=unclassified Fusibacter TaxID=2624464 RepID=UPI0010107A11|nr:MULTISPECIES: hypothetical protein [unclassified Fusibacter]MCK8058327.1 hypothetical protein [Fusibacter sp. A2]NPE20910.1 hypothetical protein [Fusibacter sp. A1]RXV63113.1 hypothetical protein DWB64_03675 [Fusibacter sp. A1]